MRDSRRPNREAEDRPLGAEPFRAGVETSTISTGYPVGQISRIRAANGGGWPEARKVGILGGTDVRKG